MDSMLSFQIENLAPWNNGAAVMALFFDIRPLPMYNSVNEVDNAPDDSFR
jgi:hypothetical protein